MKAMITVSYKRSQFITVMGEAFNGRRRHPEATQHPYNVAGTIVALCCDFRDVSKAHLASLFTVEDALCPKTPVHDHTKQKTGSLTITAATTSDRTQNTRAHRNCV